MTTNTAYEVRVQRKGRWSVEAIFDDENLAIAAARRVESRGASSSVVVLKEIYDAARNHLKSRSVYRSGKPLSSSAGKLPKLRVSRHVIETIFAIALATSVALLLL